MRALAVRMAGSQAAILINDLVVHYEELADDERGQEAKSPDINGTFP
jgi:hypothetical protein